MKTLGIDMGSSSVKVSLMDVATGRCIASSTNPKVEMPIDAPHGGWAEQDPERWWRYICDGIRAVGETGSLADATATQWMTAVP